MEGSNHCAARQGVGRKLRWWNDHLRLHGMSCVHLRPE
jgi:hypothetical protein